MTTFAKKVLVVMAAVGAMTFGSGVMSVSAANPNQLTAGDGGSSIPVVVAGVTDLETVPQGRHRIGFLPE